MSEEEVEARQEIKETINKLLTDMTMKYGFVDDDTLSIIREEFNLV